MKILNIVAIIAVIFIGYSVYKENRAEDTSTKVDTTPEPAEISDEKTTELDDEKTTPEKSDKSETSQWIPYENKDLGISFSYPAHYATRADCIVRQSDPPESPFTYLDLGVRMRISIRRVDATAFDFNTYTEHAKKDFNAKGLTFESATPITVGGKPGGRYAFRFGGMNRYGENIYVINEGKEYRFAFEAGASECDTDKLYEPQVFSQVVQTVKFIKWQ